MSLCRFLIFYISIFCCASCKAETCETDKVLDYFRKNGYEGATLSDSLSIDEVESKESVLITKSGEEISVPFGRINSLWKDIKSEYKEGDCILFFTTSDSSWESLSGREGYVIVRDNKVINSILTELN
jgi:hypothetical protein